MTFNDLAKQLNLSTATISRALSRPEIVAPETRMRVLDAVRRSGYQMHGIARSLRTQSTQTIGIVVSDICNPFFSSIVKAVEDVARTNGYTVLICNADEDGRNEEGALRLFIERQVSGVIRCSAGANPSLLKVVHQKSIPIIDLDRQSGLPNIDTVVVDNELGACLATRHLVELGHKRIAIVSGPQHLSNGRDRLEGFRKTLKAAHIPLPEHYIEFGDFREASGYQAAVRLLSLPDRPSAIFVANNEMMAGTLTAVRQRKIDVPRDLSLVSFDDARWAQYLEPPLTVVSQPAELMGQKAAQLLLARLHGSTTVQSVVFKPELIVRRSSAAPRD
jgi:DNA-binding LacI/PurR family transcriptional regulator